MIAINWELANWPKNERRFVVVEGRVLGAVCGWCAKVDHLRQASEAGQLTTLARTEAACVSCGLKTTEGE